MRRLWKDDSGQAIVEYILMIAVAVAAMALLVRSFRLTLVRTWKAWNGEIASPVPCRGADCKPLAPDG